MAAGQRSLGVRADITDDGLQNLLPLPRGNSPHGENTVCRLPQPNCMYMDTTNAVELQHLQRWTPGDLALGVTVSLPPSRLDTCSSNVRHMLTPSLCYDMQFATSKPISNLIYLDIDMLPYSNEIQDRCCRAVLPTCSVCTIRRFVRGDRVMVHY